MLIKGKQTKRRTYLISLLAIYLLYPTPIADYLMLNNSDLALVGFQDDQMALAIQLRYLQTHHRPQRNPISQLAQLVLRANSIQRLKPPRPFGWQMVTPSQHVLQ